MTPLHALLTLTALLWIYIIVDIGKEVYNELTKLTNYDEEQ